MIHKCSVEHRLEERGRGVDKTLAQQLSEVAEDYHYKFGVQAVFRKSDLSSTNED
jgi:hypothetical protein